MSSAGVTGHSNGGPPARLATIAEILAASETQIALPGLSAILGEPCSLKIRKLARAEFQLCLPPSAPSSETWERIDPAATKAEQERVQRAWAEKEAAWLATLASDVLEARRSTLADLNVKVVAMAALDPALTVEQARRLGDDALIAASEILRFSGITTEPKKDEETKDEAPATSSPIEAIA